MKKRFKAFVMNPWTIAIGAASFPVLLTMLFDRIHKVELFTTLKVVFTGIGSAIVFFLNIQLRVWWLLVGISILVIIVYLWLKYTDRKHPLPTEPEFLQYNRDIILGFNWKWDWEKYYGKYTITQLHAICPKCETPLIDSFHGYGRQYVCLRCGYNTNSPMPDHANVEMLIRDNVRRKYYPNE